MVTTRSSTKASSAAPNLWVHAPSNLTLIWFAISLPLVVWDSVYVLGRPHTMEGGSLFWPLYVPYKLYGEVDHVYGWKAFNAHNGFTAAQGALNVLETAMYAFYVWTYLRGGKTVAGRSTRVLDGRPAALAVLTAFSAAVMTLSKTVLYWLNEYFSGFDNIGHNTIADLIPLWIIPNGAWLIFPSYMIYVMGNEIVQGLTTASERGSIKSV
ncbi:Uu.00g003830.m01.CDS01 [Anthostomella pinea]|uniref:Uu.00g003830.m01.CDS01 n=1 Tax=Anthostomella pinea TaxID=933095 RepID=A0AAI8VJX7_9PEZI|nr:Uu.00g003830.m01.CDS01 [Anthostomella pinea]